MGDARADVETGRTPGWLAAHERIRTVAQRLFDRRAFDAVTIAEIATAAGVVPQTVLNHYRTKEALFFAGRAPWVEGPAAAVRQRPAGVSPLEALCAHLSTEVASYHATRSGTQRASFTAMVQASPVLARHELALRARAEQLLASALTDAWRTDPRELRGASRHSRPQQVSDQTAAVAAAVTASVWLGAARAVLATTSHIAHDAPDARQVAAALRRLTGDLLSASRGPLLDLTTVATSHRPAPASGKIAAS